MNLPSKAVVDFSFLLFVFLLLHFVSSFPFLIYKQLVRKEAFLIARLHCRLKYCKMLSKLQAVISQLSNALEVFSESFESKLDSDSSDEQEMILSQNISERLILLSIFSTKYREQTETPLCLVPG